MSDFASQVINESLPVEGVHFLSSEPVDRLSKKLHEAIRLHDQLEGLHGASFPARMKNVLNRLNAYRKIASTFREALLVHQDLQKMATRQTSQLLEGVNARSGKKWTETEDEILINRASNGEDVQSIGVHLGRTPGSVSSRISQLVGIQKISQEFAGKIRGQLNGEEIEGTFVGNLHKSNH